MTRGTSRGLLAFAAVAAAAGVAWFMLTERPLAVPVASPAPQTTVRIYGLGTVEARIVSQVGFEVGAALTELTADAGDPVVAGQVLAQLHTTEQEARVARAEAAVAAAGASLVKAEAGVGRAQAVLAQRRAANARQQELFGRNAITPQAAEEAQRDLEVAAADLAVAESEVAVVRAGQLDAAAALRFEQVLLDHHVLRAPFDGTIVARHVELGTVVPAGQPVFTLMDPASVWTQAYVDEERAGALAVGQSAEVRLRSLPHEVFSGRVVRIGIESDRVNEERRVWIGCDRCPAQVFLGEQAEVRISVAELHGALLVPEAAIAGFDGHRGRVWVVEGGRARQVEVVFGHRTEDALVEIVSGLPEGARAISAPVKGLSEGRLVRVTEEGAP